MHPHSFIVSISDSETSWKQVGVEDTGSKTLNDVLSGKTLRSYLNKQKIRYQRLREKIAMDEIRATTEDDIKNTGANTGIKLCHDLLTLYNDFRYQIKL